MGCTNCSTGADGNLAGCNSNGHCATGGCNKLNTFNWLADMPMPDNSKRIELVEVSFKQGARKEFFRKNSKIDVITGDSVVVETTGGKDVGRISLSGELVRLQIRKKKARIDDEKMFNVVRKANERDLKALEEARMKEKATMVKARVIARSIGLDMKIGDVEYQGDGRKATFYYTAEERVDFRELIKELAGEFRVKIEMRQIGARQESSRIGGLGDCGRELCCSTWLTDFKSVSTSAARYQNLAINQAKLSGQCGRLKCCLNYELDTYIDALKIFPAEADILKTEAGDARLMKKDIFKGIMHYAYFDTNKFYALTVESVKEILDLNKEGKKPVELRGMVIEKEVEEEEIEYVDVVGQISLKSLEKTSRKRRNKNKNQQKGPKGKGGQGNRGRGSGKGQNSQKTKGKSKQGDQKRSEKGNQSRRESGNKNQNRQGGNRGGKKGGPPKEKD